MFTRLLYKNITMYSYYIFMCIAHKCIYLIYISSRFPIVFSACHTPQKQNVFLLRRIRRWVDIYIFIAILLFIPSAWIFSLEWFNLLVLILMFGPSTIWFMYGADFVAQGLHNLYTMQFCCNRRCRIACGFSYFQHLFSFAYWIDWNLFK